MSSAKFDTAAIPIVPAMMAQRPNAGTLKGFGVPDLVPVPPLRSAWHDSVAVASGGIVYQVQVAALSTQLQSIARQKGSNGADGSFAFSPFPVYTPTGVQPPSRNSEFHMSSQCMVHLAAANNNHNFGAAPTDNICLFLYEVRGLEGGKEAVQLRRSLAIHKDKKRIGKRREKRGVIAWCACPRAGWQVS